MLSGALNQTDDKSSSGHGFEVPDVRFPADSIRASDYTKDSTVTALPQRSDVAVMRYGTHCGPDVGVGLAARIIVFPFSRLGSSQFVRCH